MKPAETKTEFIRLRAEGRSYGYISDRLHVSKTTCTTWERDLARQIDDLKKAQLAELCESYGAAKEGRIKRLGETLEKINAALEQTDFTEVDPAKLLDFKLKYMEALKEEYAVTRPTVKMESADAKGVLSALADLLDRVRRGDATAEQAQKESQILAQFLKAYETSEVKAKLDALESILTGRS